MEADGTDSGPNGYDLVPGSAPDYVPGKFGNGGDFDRANSEYLTIPSVSCPNLEIAGSQTWGVWVNPGIVTGSSRILCKGFASKELLLSSTGIPSFRLDGLAVNNVVTAVDNLEIGNYYSIIGVYDSANSKLKIFVNGLKFEVTASGSATASGDAFVMGARDDGSDNYFDGIIDDAFVFDRALTDAEIYDLISCSSPSVSASTSVSASPSASVSLSPSVSPSASKSLSPSISESLSPSNSPSISISATPSLSLSLSPSVSISVSPSLSLSLSPSASVSPSPSPPEYIDKYSASNSTYQSKYSKSNSTYRNKYRTWRN